MTQLIRGPAAEWLILPGGECFGGICGGERRRHRRSPGARQYKSGSWVTAEVHVVGHLSSRAR